MLIFLYSRTCNLFFAQLAEDLQHALSNSHVNAGIYWEVIVSWMIGFIQANLLIIDAADACVYRLNKCSTDGN